MKKLLVALTMSISTLMLTNVANAAPHFDDERHMDQRQGQSKKFRDRTDDDHEDRRRMREERGVKRSTMSRTCCARSRCWRRVTTVLLANDFASGSCSF